MESIEFERSLVEQLAGLGWPAAPFTEPVPLEDALWSLSPFLSGESPAK